MSLDDIKKIISSELSIDNNDLVYPPSSDLGDFSLPLFKMVKNKKLSPDEIAIDIKEKIFNNKKLEDILLKTEKIGSYLNFFLKPEYLMSQTLQKIFQLKNDYGRSQIGQKNVTIFEFSNINTHKDFHIGHLRNVAFGASICKIFSVNDFKVYPVSYINDFGIHVAKTIWSYKNKLNSDLGKCYSNTVKEIENNPLLVREIGLIMSDIEKHQGVNYKTWKKTRKISINNFSDIYKILKIKFKKTYFESDVIDKGLKIVDELFKKEIFRKSEGAIIADLEKFNLGVLPIIRSDGTALYPVADLALAKKKLRDFKKFKKSFIVVDVRQSLYFKQLFKVLSLIGYRQNFIHLPYEFVTLPDGMMSSRSGNSIPFIELYGKVLNKLIDESKKRHSDWGYRKLKKNSEKLAVAILKFEMLKVSANKIITFNIEEAIKFDGFSALYILYGLVRIKSILKKSKLKINNKIDYKLLSHELEKNLILKAAKYPEIVYKSYNDYDPSEIAKYLFDLIKMFNDYYQSVKILSAEDGIKMARLKFIKAISIIIENGLSLLDIESLEEI